MSRIHPDAADNLPHSRACGIGIHDHGTSCHTNCPTCEGKDFDYDQYDMTRLLEGHPYDVLFRRDLDGTVQT